MTVLALAGSTLVNLGPIGAPPAAAKALIVVYDGLYGNEGTPQFWVVPRRVYSLNVRLYGAQGANAAEQGAGGLGGEVKAKLAVKPGELLQINLGGMPENARGGWNGGGAGGGVGALGTWYGGGGGGASDIRVFPFGLKNRVLVAGGGGGGGGEGSSGKSPGYSAGGAGGGEAGANGGGSACLYFAWAPLNPWEIDSDPGALETPQGIGYGGTQSAGGNSEGCNSYYYGTAGVLGSGGSGSGSWVWNCCGDPGSPPGIGGGGGGGGGGFYGGGGGGGGEAGPGFSYSINPYQGLGGGGGGGGSSYGPSGAVLRTGVQHGNGWVLLTYRANCSAGGPCVQNASRPTSVRAAAGDHQATASFAAPRRGSPIESYTVTAFPGREHATGRASPITMKGLKNGTSYVFDVKATNEIGTGAPSTPSNRVTPAASPDAPTDAVAIAGRGEAVVGFTPPPSPPWSPITEYTVTTSPGGRIATGAASPITVAGLKPGTAYTFKVTATNGIGTGPASAPSAAVTPYDVPSAPTSVTALAGEGKATINFGAAPANGGVVLLYAVSASPGGATAFGGSGPITVGGLTNGTSYTFTVTATSNVGTGPASAPSNAVTPIGVPGAPAVVSATEVAFGEASVSFTAPASNGSPIKSYALSASSSDGGVSAAATGTGSPITVTGLTLDKTYTFTVTATNGVGVGPPSAPSPTLTMHGCLQC